MQLSMLLSFASLAAALPAAVAPAAARDVAVADTSVVTARSAPVVEDAAIHAVLMAREDFERVVPWATTAVIGGGPSFQYKAEPLGNDQFKITFYHSAPFSTLTFKYTVYAGDGVVATETLSAGTSSKAVEVSRVGESFRIVIQSV
ncbi:hypothetical protein CGCS363_v002444 [Colletotrichum siamense]|uniref:uncharacterized protein n=1 Tax=Colletotrichum siamense TaxID=690259 RepID=UPI001872FE7B|nr:uncharacterized protein CGCS363_v002444 [Colletotrichum siamense]KAF5509988.1 hypothetical protein CGCS363_v002444 [Colletotrichum siamense]